MPTGRIIKFCNPDDATQFTYIGTINSKIRDVVANWRKANEDTPWAKDATYKIEEDNIQNMGVKEIRNYALEKEKDLRAAADFSIPTEIVEEVGRICTDLQQNTLKKYRTCIERYYLWLNEKWNTAAIADFDKIDAYAKTLKGSCIYDFHCALSKYQEVAHARLKREMTKRIQLTRQNEMVRKIEKAKEENKKPAAFTMQDLITKREAIKDKTSVNYLVAALLTEIPPKRPETLATISIKEIPEKPHNYLNLETGVLLLSYTKNTRYTGIKEQQLPEKLMEIIRNYVTKHNIKDWLLQKNGNTLAKFISRLFGYSSNDIRHVFISEAIKRGDDVAELGWQMDSSGTTAMLVYGDLETPEEEDDGDEGE